MMSITDTRTGATGVLDGVLRVDFSPEASVTDHPVELGAEVSDHVQIRPYRFVVDVVVTDTPRASSLATLRTSAVAVTFLERMVGQLCNVVIDGEGAFTSYVLESAAHSRTIERGRVFTLRWREIRIASAVSVTIPPRLPAPAAQVTMPDGANLGQQAATAADVASESTLYSLGATAAGALGLGG